MTETDTLNQTHAINFELLAQFGNLRDAWEEEQSARAEGGIVALNGFEHQFLLMLLKIVQKWRNSSEDERNEFGKTQNIFTEALSDISEITLNITLTQSKLALSDTAIRDALEELWLIFSLANDRTPELIGRLNFVISGKAENVKDRSPTDVIKGWGSRSGETKDKDSLSLFKSYVRWEILLDPKADLKDELEKLARDEDALTTISRWLGYLLQLGSGISPEQVSSLIWRELKLDTSLTAFRKTLSRVFSRSRYCLQAVKNTLGGSISLPRIDLLNKFKQTILSHNLTILAGDSGSGKSALCKLFIQTEFQDYTCLFLQATDIYKFTNGFNTDQEMRRLDELLTAGILDKTIIFVEDLDTVSDQYFKSVFTFLQNAFSTDTSINLHVVLVTHSDAEQRIREEIEDHFDIEPSIGILNLPQLPIKELLANDRLPIPIKILLGRVSQFGSALNLKFLDWLIAVDQETDEEIPQLTNDLDLLDWFWRYQVGSKQNASQEKHSLISISLALADKFSPDLPLYDFRNIDVQIIKNLVRRDCIRTSEEKVAVTHRFVGDCARYFYLIGRYQELDARVLAEKIRNPLWLRPVQWLSLNLVLNEDKNDIWQDLLLEAINQECSQVIDLLLDGAILSRQPINIFTGISTDVIPSLLERVCSRLLEVATIADPIHQNYFSSITLSEKLKASTKLPGLPNPLIWLPVLTWILSLPINQLLEIPQKFFTVARSWINWSEFTADFPLRSEIASLTLDLIESLLFPVDDVDDSKSHSGSPEIFTCIIFALKLEPERATRFLRILAGRIIIPANKMPETYEDNLFHIKVKLTEPHPRGPQTRGDSDFQRFMLGQGGLYLLNAVILANPELGAELLLALTIAHPYYPYNDDLYMEDSLGTDGSSEIGVCTFKFQPLLLLLNIDDKLGIDVISTLCEVAVDNWHKYRWQKGKLEGSHKTDADGVILLIEGKRKFFSGGRHSLYWHRRYPWSPDILACFLMTLEFWLYSRPIKRDLEVAMSLIFSRANTVPMLGVLISLAKCDPSLLRTMLIPLTSSLQLFLWLRLEELDRGQNYGFDNRSIWSLSDKDGQELLDFHRLPHRRLNIFDTIRRMWVIKEIPIDIISKTLEDWDLYQIDQIPATTKESARRLRADFDPNNWQEDTDERGVQSFRFVGTIPENPEEAQQLVEANLKIQHSTLVIEFRQILDKEKTLSPELCKMLVELLTNEQQMQMIKEQYSQENFEDLVWGAIAVLVENVPNIMALSPQLDEVLNQVANNPSRFYISLNLFERCQIFDIDASAFAVRATPKLLSRIQTQEKLRVTTFRCLIGLRNQNTSEFIRTLIRENSLSDALTHDLIKVIPQIARLISLTRFFYEEENIKSNEVEQAWTSLEIEFKDNILANIPIDHALVWVPTSLTAKFTHISQFSWVQRSLDWFFLAAALIPVFKSTSSEKADLLILKTLRDQFFAALLSERKIVAEDYKQSKGNNSHINKGLYKPQIDLLIAAASSAPLEISARINEIFDYMISSGFTDYIFLEEIISALANVKNLDLAMEVGNFLIKLNNHPISLTFGKEYKVWENLIEILSPIDQDFTKFFDSFKNVMLSQWYVKYKLYEIASHKHHSQYRRALFITLIQNNSGSEFASMFSRNDVNPLIVIIANLWEGDRDWLTSRQERLTGIKTLIGQLRENNVVGAEQLSNQIANDLK